MPRARTEPRVELEFTKVLVSPVVQRRVDGKVVGEVVNDPVALFSADEVTAFMEEVERQTAAANAAVNPSRSQRRSRQK